MNGFGKNIMAQVNLWYWYSNIILDTGIENNDDCLRIH